MHEDKFCWGDKIIKLINIKNTQKSPQILNKFQGSPIQGQ